MCNEKIKPLKQLWHDSSQSFLTTIEPKINEPVGIYLRAEKHSITYAFVEISNDGENFTGYPMSFHHLDKTEKFEYWMGEIPGQTKMFKYRFRVGNGGENCEVYYSRSKISTKPPLFNENNMDPDDLWCLIPGFHTPDWAKGVLWYSIMPDAYYNGDLTNDEPFSGDNFPCSWNNVQHTLQYKYGGDLKGIEKKLKYIKDLGCEAIFMDPIFKSTQNAGYGPEFYKQIENSFGNAKALEDLAKAVHDNGMHYMIDVVLAFVAMKDIWFNSANTNPLPGVAQDINSKYHDYFFFDGEPDDLSKVRGKWGGVELNHANEDLCNKIYKGKDSYLQYYTSAPFNVDAIRFDCGGDLYGTYPDGTSFRDWQVVEKIRPILRKINPELLMLSEYSMYYSVDHGTWDSRWNLEFVNNAIKYMKGEFPESQVAERINHEILNLPRNFALCQYTSIADHDRPRTHGVENWAFRAYQLIQMTTVCAPCIYYGDEIKIEREHGTFYSMQWNEALWNYTILNNTRALAELRKKYSAIKQGAIKNLIIDNDRRLYAFARKDNCSTVITCASRNPYPQKTVIDTIDLEETDGTVFTDWFTGEKYISKNGKITLSLMPGGSVFVKGTESSKYFDKFETIQIGNSNASSIFKSNGSIFLSGNGRISNSDNLTFTFTPLFNECRISARPSHKGTGLMMLRANSDTSSPMIAVKTDKNGISVYVRKHQGGNVKRVIKSSNTDYDIIEISRDSFNNLSVSFGRTDLNCKEVLIENIRVDLPNRILGGFSVLNGNCHFEDIITAYEKNPIRYDCFNNGYSAMFDVSENAFVRYNKGGLHFSSKNGKAELLTNTFNEDWTFKALVKSQTVSDTGYYGIISKQDDDCYLIAGRSIIDGEPVFFIGRATGGKLAVHYTLKDKRPKSFATIQLQRIGTMYSAVVSYDAKKFTMIGHPIIANLCAERIGLTVTENVTADYRFASFGNAVNDSLTFNTPITPGKVIANFSNMSNVLSQPAYRTVSGDWDYANEGYIQKDPHFAQMGVENKYFKGFKADGTYLFDNGNGFIGIEFGKPAFNTPPGDGVLLKIELNGKISVIKNGTAIADKKHTIRIGEPLRICAEYRFGTLIIYIGQTAEPFIVLRDFDIPSGYISYYTQNTVAHINNSLIASFDSPAYCAADYETFEFSNKSFKKQWSHNNGFLNLSGIAVTDFTVSADFDVKFSPGTPTGCAGFCITSPEGKLYENKAIRVVFDQYGQLFIKNGDKMLVMERFIYNPEQITHLKVTKLKGKISAFINDTEKPIVSFTTGFDNGGVISVYAEKVTGEFSNLIIKDDTELR